MTATRTNYAESSNPHPSTCVNCGAAIEDGGYGRWVDTLSGDLGGTYDFCPASPAADDDIDGATHEPEV